MDCLTRQHVYRFGINEEIQEKKGRKLTEAVNCQVGLGCLRVISKVDQYWVKNHRDNTRSKQRNQSRLLVYKNWRINLAYDVFSRESQIGISMKF